MEYTITDTPPTPTELGELYLQASFVKVADESKMAKAVESQSCWYVARDKSGRVLGIGRYISDYARYACIYDLIVEKKHQGLGIGTEIMSRIIADCIKFDIDTVHLWPTKGKISFYNRFAFKALNVEQPVMTLDKTAANNTLQPTAKDAAG